MFSLSKVGVSSAIARSSFFSIRTLALKGDSIPSTKLFENSPGNDVDLNQETASGTSVIIGVPGAFSPGCTKNHIPEYLKNLDAFKGKGVEQIFVVAVNDPFVTKAWGEQLLKDNSAPTSATEAVRFLADSTGAFTRDLGLLFDATKVFGNERSKRYALLVRDGKVAEAFVEPDNTSVDVSAAPKVLNILQTDI
ncbi:conserved hypothetical protein [Lodderomyces elongisporus NRRL YB-4239]|uniref:Thioredoxin domain-containing protein n=1 Tax=Lodderomyces elongisporus (strain ATCC 11503 / CBS 2605 / JCM 1781 / NBRC 1676 / NRRL YB-4239) TaxID=379508 RepID=A5DWK7_LODEL|nr:conserved hypothetical protein [Lodderomyces elongisporus NRRL YB-4239]